MEEQCGGQPLKRPLGFLPPCFQVGLSDLFVSPFPPLWIGMSMAVVLCLSIILYWDLASEMASHHFCCILFLRSWSVGPSYTQRVDHWDMGPLGAILKSAYYIQNTFTPFPNSLKSHCITTSAQSPESYYWNKIRVAKSLQDAVL